MNALHFYLMAHITPIQCMPYSIYLATTCNIKSLRSASSMWRLKVHHILSKSCTIQSLTVFNLFTIDVASEGRLDIVLLIQQQSHNRWAYIYNVTTPLSQHEDSSKIARHCDIRPTDRSTSVSLLSGWKDIPVCCQNEKTYMCVVATSLRRPMCIAVTKRRRTQTPLCKFAKKGGQIRHSYFAVTREGRTD